MRTMWKGYLKVSLVTVPVKMYAATSRSTLRFHLVHAECNTRIKQQNYCPTCERVVAYEELVRGYPYGQEQYVLLEEEDFEKARKETTDAISVVRFVDGGQIEPIYYSDTHYLAPDGKVAAQAFALLLQALEEAGKSALARVVLRNREQVLAIRPYRGILAAYTLRYADEIRDPGQIGGLDELEAAEADEGELKMARTLIDNLSGDFSPEEFEDEYTKHLTEIVEAKAEGEQVEVAPAAGKEKVVNLMDALKQSLERTEKAPKKKPVRAGKGRKTPKKAEEG